jgi:uncharacterized membrane protein YqaE (UPF0057 family)
MMLYLIAIILPPPAVLLCGKPIQAMLNAIACLTIIGWIPGIIHVCLVASSHHADKRNDRLVREMRRQRQ